MSEEEKQAIEKLKRKVEFCKDYRNECKQRGDWCDCFIEIEEINAIEKILNLIDKQQKEIEELKQDYQILKDDMEGHRVAYIDTPEFEEKFISKDKIREKIKELKSIGKYKLDHKDLYLEQENIDLLKELLGEEK